MAPMERRLAAILAADVVGSTRLIEQDEAGTLAALRERRTGILEPLVAAHHGRIVKVMGDGVLAEFASAVNAVDCAVELQERMSAANQNLANNRRIVLRIGVNLGDVVVEDGDLYGDGVIIAVRLEGIAEPGSILVSGSAYDQVRNKVKAAFDNLGLQELKNIAEPVRAYRVQSSPAANCRRQRAAAPARHAVDRRAALQQPQQRCGPGCVLRRPDRRPDHRYLADARPVRHRPQFELRLQGQDRRRARASPATSACAISWRAARGGPRDGCASTRS